MKHDVEKEEEIRQTIDSQKEEVFVDIDRPKAQEAAKHLEMKQELPLDQTREQKAAESRVKQSVVDERMTKSEVAEIKEQQNVQVPSKPESEKLNDLKNRIEEKAKE